ncbi:hypothetical protein RDWZM_006409 [Blomia tropicalis]|uniref:CUB domain-containing protein n=1 Tax=Blomia tropicalis TaxID=40697 RepID=A0A9Q0M7V2_BLOTA|nr:hypothetical protein RDWZM_006409 [Blomia tropicalis]
MASIRAILIGLLFIHHTHLIVSSQSNVTESDNWEYRQNRDSDRTGRTFFGDIGGFLRPSIFNIVRFPNEECLDASNQSGTCYTALECKKLGGNPSSKCARGLGTCCIMSRTCHNSTSNKVVYFKNPSYPLTDSGQNFCDLSINIYDPDICQLRIDFLEFQIDGPINGDCVGDKFTVTASGMTPTSVPVLCGNNRNQHNYAICIERQPDTCRIIYTSTDANFGIEAGGTVISRMPGVGDQDCANDYLLLPGGSQNGEGQTKDRFCGGVLSYANTVATTQPVISKANGPIVIRFHSDTIPTVELKEGFRVKYEQSPTDCAVLNSGTVSQQNIQNLNNPQFIPNPVALAVESGPSANIKVPIATKSEHMSEQTRARNNGKHLVF